MFLEFSIPKKTKDKDYKHLINLLDDQPLLYTLNFGQNNLNVIKAINHLAYISDITLTVKELNFSHGHLHNLSFDCIDFNNFDFIETINLQNNENFTCKGFKRLLRKLHSVNQFKIKSLNLSKTGIEKYGCISLVSYMKHGLFEFLTDLDLSYCNLNGSLVFLMESLSYCNNLQLLDINNCINDNDNDDSVLMLGNVMMTNCLQQLKYLDLSWNNFGMGSLLNVMKALSLGSCQELKYLNFFMIELTSMEYSLFTEAIEKGYLNKIEKIVLTSLSTRQTNPPIYSYFFHSVIKCQYLYNLCVKIDYNSILLLMQNMKPSSSLENIRYFALDTDCFSKQKNTKTIIYEIIYNQCMFNLSSLRIWFSKITRKNIKLLANAFRNNDFCPKLDDFLCVKSFDDDNDFIMKNSTIWRPIQQSLQNRKIKFTTSI